MAKILPLVNTPEDLQKLTIPELHALAGEIRTFIVEGISAQGGHLAANLGVVELTIALHYVLHSPHDKIVWDVGHQAYAHKILTGRKERFHTVRQSGGLSGFPNIDESPHDHFTVGHASTSLSQAFGLAVARDLAGEDFTVACVCGDGSLTGGLAFEGLNNIGHLKKKMLIVLNDNEMAISKSIGSMSKYLNKIITNPIYNRIRSDVERTIERFPRISRFARRIEESFKNIVVPGIVFEELGIRYFGPIDGHDIEGLVKTIRNLTEFEGPCLLHVLTKKGKGVQEAEIEPATYHSSGPYRIEGSRAGTITVVPKEREQGTISFTKAFSNSLMRVAERDKKIVAITAAMPDGAGLLAFQEQYPDRFFDVGIAEGHAVTFAGALCRLGYKPVCAIYSTFLQRAYDNIMHDVALQRANVTFCLDRAGIVGADGPTHHGLFDIAFMRTVPGSVVCAPKDEAEMQRMLDLGVDYAGVFAIRYPKTSMPLVFNQEYGSFAIGEGEILCEGADVAILSLGSMVPTALEVASLLHEKRISAGVYNMRFAKPLDEKLLLDVAANVPYILTIEEHVGTGGFGAAVTEFLAQRNIHKTIVHNYAFPTQFIEHGNRDEIFKRYGLDAASIAKKAGEVVRACKR